MQVTRWLEPFIDYGADYDRATPLHGATIALGRHARELFNRRGGVQEAMMFSTMQANNVSASQTPRLTCTNAERDTILKLTRLLCEHRTVELRKMQREMESVMSSAVSRNFEPAANAAEVAAALVDRAKQATLWRVNEPRDAQMQDALAQREICLMRSYRPRLLRAGTAAARIRSDVFNVLVQTGRWVDAEGAPIGESELFWDGIFVTLSCEEPGQRDAWNLCADLGLNDRIMKITRSSRNIAQQVATPRITHLSLASPLGSIERYEKRRL